MRAIVLVGGEGTRLRPLTYLTPKQLLPVVEVPMLERVLAHLGGHGVDEAVLSIGYRPDAFAAAYPDGKAAGVRLSYAVEPELLDTAGAIRFAAEHAGIDETFIVVNGDVLTDLDVGALVAFHRAHGAEATIDLTAVEDPSRFGVVPTDDEGRVIAFVEKPPPGEAPTNLINAGTYVLEPSVLGRIPGGRRVSIERETFPALAADGTLFASASDSYWLDTGTPAAYLQAHADLLDGTRAGAPAPGAMPLAEGVWALDEPRVDGDVGPASLVGAGAVVAAGATVRGSVVGAGAVIEPGARLAGSVVLP
ncbi:MAG TPA: NDP-sugar synthase, partial [Acidimicrobiales bacterium]|nr:NDP-sugar synthase [Acidimicrobiales bacterium]